jgi:hypothetical protein
VHIKQWLTGEMSSREFITLVEGLPDESWFKCQLKADIEEAKNEAVDEVALRARARMLTGLYRKVPVEKRGMYGNSH